LPPRRELNRYSQAIRHPRVPCGNELLRTASPPARRCRPGRGGQPARLARTTPQHPPRHRAGTADRRAPTRPSLPSPASRPIPPGSPSPSTCACGTSRPERSGSSRTCWTAPIWKTTRSGVQIPSAPPGTTHRQVFRSGSFARDCQNLTTRDCKSTLSVDRFGRLRCSQDAPSWDFPHTSQGRPYPSRTCRRAGSGRGWWRGGFAVAEATAPWRTTW
jgi:hypothetical protein